jgi:hypothetical protein
MGTVPALQAQSLSSTTISSKIIIIINNKRENKNFPS